jgi:serine/threonine-protein kinase
VYSLGIVLFEMLTGRLPFSGGSAVDIAMQQVTAQPPRPRTINPRIGPQVEAVIMRALAKDPAHRYADAGELLADLRRVGGGRNPSQETQQATRVMAAATPAAAQEAYARTGVMPPPAQPPAPPEKRRRGAGPWILLALLLVALAAIGYVAYTELIGNRVQIPDVRGRTQARAVRILENRGLQVETRAEQSDQIAAGRALGTEPGAGQEVSEGSTVVLIVSAGPDVFEVPDVGGMTYDEARAEIERLGLVAEQGEVVNSPTVEEGLVVRTEPRAGAQVTGGDTVTVFVSSGEVEVPDLLGGGLTAEGAAAALEEAGLALGDVSEEPSDTAPEGIVIGQGIEAGTVVAQGTTVDITVSTGPELVEVPDVRTLTVAEGVAQLQDAGFEVRIVQGGDLPPESIIVGQQPNGGERPLGSRIDLYVAAVEQPPDGGGEGGGDGDGG